MSIDFIGLKLDTPFMLAPLAGISDGVFRYICKEQGASLSCTEMVSAKGLYYNSAGSAGIMRIEDREGPVGIQFFTSEPEMIVFAAEQSNKGKNVYFDINMGCPVPKVVKNGEGSALLKSPRLAAELVAAAARASEKPVTVKIRRGFSEDPAEGEIDIAEFAAMLESAGARAIAVHGRYREQYYSGKADWDVIKRIKQSVSIPVIGNGDVFCADDALRMMDYTGCDMVMVARGALGNPWIFRELKAAYEGKPIPARPDADEIAELMRRHIELSVIEKGERRAVKEIRKHVGWYTKGLKNGAEFRRLANNALSLEELEQLINKFRDRSL